MHHSGETVETVRISETNKSILQKEIFQELIDAQPQLVKAFIPSNLAEERERFMTHDDVSYPEHKYDAIDEKSLDALEHSTVAALRQIYDSVPTSDLYLRAYEELAATNMKKSRLLKLAHALNSSIDEQQRTHIEAEYMRLNIELYGEPNEDTYRALLVKKIVPLLESSVPGDYKDIQNELSQMVSGVELGVESAPYVPRPETIAWSRDVAIALYEPFLRHVDESVEQYDVRGITDVLKSCLGEFEESAGGWSVIEKKGATLSVEPAKKTISVGENLSVGPERLRALLAHEVGVHVLRSVMGAETDAPFLSIGLDGYLDSEEGLGRVMEESIEGRYGTSGVNHYIAAGAAYFDNFSFRDVYELKWRVEVLSSVIKDENAEIDRQKEKMKAYANTLRIFRGTNYLPWFKDLSYHNGAEKMWKHLDDICGDDVQLSLMLTGKLDPAKMFDRRLALEASTIE